MLPNTTALNSDHAEVESPAEPVNFGTRQPDGRPRGVGKKIWIDFDNSPHVPFFLPIIEELRRRGHTVILTARNSYQVVELLEFHHVSCAVIGSHWGKYRIFKILGTLLRAARLLPTILREKPDLAVSHGSRAQGLSCRLLRIPTLAIADYEFTAKIGISACQWVFVPRFFPESAFLDAHKKQIMRYPGIKEDVYIPRFHPDPTLKQQLGLDPKDLMVTVRPPAIEAHYHNPEAEVLLGEALNFLMERPDVRVVLLPRNERQAKLLRKDWGKWIANRRILIPEQVVDGLNLIWCSDLVISGGGTMNREAAALGVPVYSIFRGRIGGVDKYLASSGRLTLLEAPADVRSKIILERGDAAKRKTMAKDDTLQCIVEGIVSIVEHQRLPENL